MWTRIKQPEDVASVLALIDAMEAFLRMSGCVSGELRTGTDGIDPSIHGAMYSNFVMRNIAGDVFSYIKAGDGK